MTKKRLAARLLLATVAFAVLAGCVSQVHSAVNRNEMDRLQSGVAAGNIERRDWQDRTPLILAAQENNMEMVRYLVNEGADIHAATPKGGYTALRWACTNGNIEMARFLIDRGADVTQTNESGWTPLHSAAKYGHSEIVKLLLSEGAVIDAETESGVTPARVAGQNGYVDITVYLMLRQREEQGELL